MNSKKNDENFQQPTIILYENESKKDIYGDKLTLNKQTKNSESKECSFNSELIQDSLLIEKTKKEHSDDFNKKKKLPKIQNEYANANNPNHPSYNLNKNIHIDCKSTSSQNNQFNNTKSSVKQYHKLNHKTKHKKHIEKPYSSFLHSTTKKTKEQFPEDIIETTSIENFFDPEYLVFSYLRQKTGSNPLKFWDNLHLILKNKSFIDIKSGEMTLIAYSAIYDAVEIFEKLMFEYGHLLSQTDIENSIFKLTTNKTPSILQTTINFYDENYKPSEDFINKILTIATKESYREEANQLLINWLSDKMTDSSKNHFWKVCLSNRNISFLSLALDNPVLKIYLKHTQSEFLELIKNSGREHTILNSLNSPTVAYKEDTIQLTNVIPLIKEIEKNSTLHNFTETKTPDIIIKKKRKTI